MAKEKKSETSSVAEESSVAQWTVDASNVATRPTKPEPKPEPAADGVATLTFAQIKELLAAVRSEPSAFAGDVEKLLLQVAQTNAAAMQTALIKENPNYPEKSPYTYPEGERARPKPRLSRKTFFNGARERDDFLTPEEVDLYNAITETRTTRNSLWKAEVKQNGSAQELWVSVPAASVDARMDLPALVSILRELATGAPSDEASLMKELKALREELEALKAAHAA